MEYISVLEASEKWGISLRQVQRLLAAKRIPRAKKYGRSWMIPDDAEKPVDLRNEKKQNIMLEIYEKLDISSRDELAQYILLPNKEANENRRSKRLLKSGRYTS